MYIASLTGVEIASRLPVISAEAMDALVAGQRRADAVVDAFAQFRRRWSRSAARTRRPPAAGLILIAPSAKPEAPMRWKYMSRAKS